MTEYTTISSAIPDAFMARLQALRTIDTMAGDCPDDDPLWNVIATAEEAIRSLPPSNRDDIAAKLWIALSHLADIDTATIRAVNNRHLAFFDDDFAEAARQSPKDEQWPIALIVSAIRGLQHIPKHQPFTLDREADEGSLAATAQACVDSDRREAWTKASTAMLIANSAYRHERDKLAEQFGVDWIYMVTADDTVKLDDLCDTASDAELALLATPAPSLIELRWKLDTLLAPDGTGGGVAAWSEDVVRQTREDMKRLLPATVLPTRAPDTD